MHKLNGLSSAMISVEENLNDTEAMRQTKIEIIKLRELSKSPHCIGSVYDIESKISNLEKQIKEIKSDHDWFFSDSEEEAESGVQERDKRNEQREKREVAQFAGVFSVVSNYSFNKPERIKKIAKQSLTFSKSSTKNSDEKALPKFIELCEYPGFENSTYTELPCSIRPDFILRRVYKAQPHPFIDSFKKFFERWFFSESIQNMLKDIFWFFFISRYGSDLHKHDLSSYFSRTATNYADFLFQISTEPLYHQEKFKKKLPDLLSQAVYAALSESFPDSWIQFDEEFIDRIIVLVYFWFAGIRCTKGIWRHWDMHELKPTEQKIRESIIEEQSKLGYTDNQINKNNGKQASDVKHDSVKSTFVGPMNDSKCVLLNLNGHSPLVQYYLLNKSGKPSAAVSTVIKHKEIIPIKINESSKTYSKVISDSLEEQKSRIELFHKSSEKHKIEMKKYFLARQKASSDTDKRREKLLHNKRIVHNISNIMVHEYLKDKDSISFNADAIVRSSIDAME